MSKYIFPTTTFPPLCYINGNEPIYKYALYVYSKKGRMLYLIRPKYTPLLPKNITIQLDEIPIIHINGTECKSNYINPEDQFYQISCIWQIHIPISINVDNDITVKVDDFAFTAHSIDAHFEHIQDITICTLFKDDYKNMQIFIDYNYNYHQIKSYLLYYNGKLDDIKTCIDSLILPKDVKVIFFSLNYDYLQPLYGLTPDSEEYRSYRDKYWPLQSQSIQLSHSCIIANYWSNFLLNIDYDEYIDPTIKLDTTYDKMFLYYTNPITTCGGKLCHRDYNYSYEDIIPNIIIEEYENPRNLKYMQRTLNKNIFNRCVHRPYEWSGSLLEKQCLHHIKCLSYDKKGKRYCTPISLK